MRMRIWMRMMGEAEDDEADEAGDGDGVMYMQLVTSSGMVVVAK